MLSLVKKLRDPSWPDTILKQTNLMMLDMPVAPSLFFLPSVVSLHLSFSLQLLSHCIPTNLGFSFLSLRDLRGSGER